MTDKDLVTVQQNLKEEVTSFIIDAFTSSETIIALASGSKAALPAAVGHFVKAGINSKKIFKLMRELMFYESEGHILGEAIAGEVSQDGMLNILDALDKENIDEERFKLMKKIYFQSLRTENKLSLAEREYLIQAKKLLAVEIVILFYASDNSGQGQKETYEQAFRSMSEAIELPWEMCKIHYKSLEEKGFVHLKDRDFYAAQGLPHGKVELEVTTFGRGFCHFVKEFDRFEKSLTRNEN